MGMNDALQCLLEALFVACVEVSLGAPEDGSFAIEQQQIDSTLVH
jgi:hypothetical protein